MKQLYVVRRTFRNGGEKLFAGTILENLDNIKLAGVRLSEWKIIPIPKDKEKLAGICTYFKARVGVDLAAKLAARASKGSESAEPVKPAASIPPPGTLKKPTTEPTKVKPVAKPVTTAKAAVTKATATK